ncbi:beta-N-acetylhexosaminidase [bacterium]|nr:beta-N-acetylhexosaminidase [bacterium]
MDQLTLPLIPRPETVTFTGGSLKLPLRMSVFTTDEVRFERIWAPLRSFAHEWLPGLMLRPVVKPDTAVVRIGETSDGLAESYSLSIRDDRIGLRHTGDAGLFYALITLLQLLATADRDGDNLLLPTLELNDRPRFRWRGMHLDVARHFFPVDVIKRYLDVLALHKINTFHWHLTDDQGWRIEIRRYPKLTEAGAWRTEADGSRSGGFYTRTDIREVVAYAADRYITVVPEIEMPGHARAALAGYPEYSCTGEGQPVPSAWGVFEDVFCAGNPKTLEFLEDVLETVFALFPGPFVHIGGDEVPDTRWRHCPTCRMKQMKEFLQSPAHLQNWLLTEVLSILHRHDRRMVGWDEIADLPFSNNAVVMAWRSSDNALAAAMNGHQVVMSPTAHCYFDYAQAEDGEPDAFPAVLTLDQVLEFDPAPSIWPEFVQSQVLGGQGNLWTERITTEQHLQYMLLPRLSALADRLWSPQDATVDKVEFRQRLNRFLPLLDKLGVNYRSLD